MTTEATLISNELYAAIDQFVGVHDEQENTCSVRDFFIKAANDPWIDEDALAEFVSESLKDLFDIVIGDNVDYDPRCFIVLETIEFGEGLFPDTLEKFKDAAFEVLHQSVTYVSELIVESRSGPLTKELDPRPYIMREGRAEVPGSRLLIEPEMRILLVADRPEGAMGMSIYARPAYADAYARCILQ
jgi:hypothetical protein